MGKQPRSFSLDEDLLELMKQSDVNDSELVNRFLQEYYAGSQSNESMLALRRERLEGELADVEKRKKQLERDIDQLTQKLEVKKDERRDVFNTIDKLNIPDDAELTPEDELWKTHAEGLSIGPQKLYEEYTEYQE